MQTPRICRSNREGQNGVVFSDPCRGVVSRATLAIYGSILTKSRKRSDLITTAAPADLYHEWLPHENRFGQIADLYSDTAAKNK
jgi:hypothetical protein